MATPRIVRVAAIQLAPDLETADGTLDRVCAAIERVAKQGVKLAVFPETFLPYYPYFSFVLPPVLQGLEHLKLYDRAIIIPGPATARVAQLAREHGIAVLLGVNERDHGSLYNTQLLFDAEGELRLKRRKITPTYHERMIWGQGDASGLKVVELSIGRIGALACWEHYNPLARYALMTQHEEIHCAQFPGSLVGEIFADQMGVAIRHHALEAGCFVINATGWLLDEQISRITSDPVLQRALRGGCHTAIVTPEGRYLAGPLSEGEGELIADLDLALVTKRKRMMDSVGHYARPELLSLAINDRAASTSQPMTIPHSQSHARPPKGDTHGHSEDALQSPSDDGTAVRRLAAG